MQAYQEKQVLQKNRCYETIYDQTMEKRVVDLGHIIEYEKGNNHLLNKPIK